LSFVIVEITDEKGNMQPNANNLLLFDLTGPGIAGVANANMKDTASYMSNTRKAWHGRALVIIKSYRKPGEINLKVSAPGFSEANIMVHCRD